MPAPIKWNPLLGQYVSSDDTIVPQLVMQSQVKRIVAAQTNKIERLSRSLRAGHLSLAEWEAEIVRVLKVEYVAVARAADGALPLSEVQRALDEQIGYLDNFAKQIQLGEQKLDGRFLNRAQQYGKSAWNLHQEVYRAQRADRGYTRERRIVNETLENCADCIAQADLGWQPIQTLKALGDSKCGNNCACHFEFDQGIPLVVPIPVVRPLSKTERVVSPAPLPGARWTKRDLDALMRLLDLRVTVR